MVYDLVYDQNSGHVPPHPLAMPYMSLTCDWVLGIVNQLYAAVKGCVYS